MSRRCQVSGCADSSPTPAGVSRHVRGAPAGDVPPKKSALTTLADAARASGVEIDELSAGATPTARFSLQQAGLTEYRPGNLRLLRSHAGWPRGGDPRRLRADRPEPRGQQVGAGSRHSRRRQQDAQLRWGARLSRRSPGTALVFPEVSERHPATSPDPGLDHRAALGGARDGARRHAAPPRSSPATRCACCPNHSCVVTNLVDQLWLVDGDRVEPLPVAARGKIQ